MLDFSELTIVNNAEGMPTALGYLIKSLLLQNNKVGGGSGGRGSRQSSDFEHLSIPAGLVCTTETICTRPYNVAVSDDMETVPEGLYEKLLLLAETKPLKKLSRRNDDKLKHKKHGNKNKTHKRRR